MNVKIKKVKLVKIDGCLVDLKRELKNVRSQNRNKQWQHEDIGRIAEIPLGKSLGRWWYPIESEPMVQFMKCKHKHVGDRKRIGPTGRKYLVVLVERCYSCGIIIPVKPEELTYEECMWIEKYNGYVEKINNEQEEISS